MTKRFVLIYGQVFRWEEKAPFERSGKSIKGAIEYDPTEDKIRCHECGKWFAHLGPHISFRHGLVAREYKDRHGLNRSTGLCSVRYSEHKRIEARRNLLQAPAPIISRKKRQAIVRKSISAIKERKASPSGSSSELQNFRSNCCQQTIFAIQQLAIKLGTTPSHTQAQEQMQGSESSLLSAAIGRFGTWSAACLAAGLQPNSTGGGAPIRYSQALLRETLIDFYQLNRRIPKTKDFSHGRLASNTTYCKYFGSVKAALQDAGLGLVAAKETARRK